MNIVDGRFQPLTKRELQDAIKNMNSIEYPIGEWDVSLITDMSELFNGIHLFNSDISNWDVSNVTNMKKMFYNCKYFNQPLNNWNVSNVTNMDTMFAVCLRFNQPLNNWNVSNVKSMETMFFNCHIFNQPLNNWNVSQVTNMKKMFYNCRNFNQSLNNWNVSNVTNMERMFFGCINFNKPLYWRVNSEILDNHKQLDNMFFDLYPQFNRGIGLLVKGHIEEYKQNVEEYHKRLLKRVTKELDIQSKRQGYTSKKRDDIILNPDLNKEIEKFLGGVKRRKRSTMKKKK